MTSTTNADVDDGSGSLTLLEVATHLTQFSVKNCVRFAWWAGEEEVSTVSYFLITNVEKLTGLI